MAGIEVALALPVHLLRYLIVKLKLVLESDQWKTMKMLILSNRHVKFLFSVCFLLQEWNTARKFLHYFKKYIYLRRWQQVDH